MSERPTMNLTIDITVPGDLDTDTGWATDRHLTTRLPLTLDQATRLRDLLDRELDPADTVRLRNSTAIMWQTRCRHTRLIGETLDRIGIDRDGLRIPDQDHVVVGWTIYPWPNW
ncbi:hypothetical protein Uis1B_2215 [Bifidobacterium margollesii]|uniref:Uncharacterized protein n=1 Tax=Bifidobacterium margollesii TaxID=2020964 RepID=A0A2N5J6Y9_9BIFI|nr:hypothetical protein [Bifidobacterium margollesii]PLS29947.1 hypothetical protein Uis1B_2215 [Bifidobacterium margollesii]